MRRLMTMRAALEDLDIFGTILPGESWAAWRVLLIAIMGEALTAEERAIYTALTGREREPEEPVEEAWAIIGRRGGKTRAMAVLMAYFAVLCDWDEVLAPGERGSLPLIAASTYQAGKALNYIGGIFEGVPGFAGHQVGRTADTISLDTGVDIEVRPASFRTARGGTLVAALCDEAAFWRIEGSANPDKEILAALRPGLATTGGPLIVISSPYAKRGELYAAYRRDYGPDGDPAVLVAKAPSRTMNPTLSETVIARAYQRDAAAARAEYGGDFRDDLEDFVSVELVDACTMAGTTEVPPAERIAYHAFVDPAGGSGKDSMTLAIAHEAGGCAVLDRVLEKAPPFSPQATVTEFAAVLKAYRVTRVTGDRWGGEWPREAFREHGITYELAEMPKSEIYQAALPLLNSRRARLLDLPKLKAQLTALERRTARGGRDSIDHPPGEHDDVANAVAGVLIRARRTVRYGMISDAVLGNDGEEERRAWRAGQLMQHMRRHG
ncbi:hypothetical protein OPKNFCMD_5468 [Methylobacterium crusticola]|uniref:Terminase n=1 Tax=Methylobacterium crusticola TaxID=1697972 RepID=A0ABQ4R7I9_9HYPH|nr:hypothetical protein [Methylobacterium crusticola]GJD52702.1 hypothetical protein OPKNFCMD_5468 [Methylobacterium crusticola]